jgi:hypothetical protein
MSCCRADGCCGGFVGILVLVFSLFTVGFPWYFRAQKVVGTECEVLALTSWIDEYYYTKNCDGVAIFPSNLNWQNQCDTPDAYDGCSDRKRVFDVTLGLVAVSAFCSLFVALGFCIRCCSSGHKRRNPLHVVMSVTSLLLLVLALVYFAVEAPKTNFWCVDSTDQNCHRLWGHNSQLDITWGPAGWAAGCITALMISLSLCMSCQRSTDEVELGTYYSVGDHSEATMANRYATHNYSHTATGTNYVGQ